MVKKMPEATYLFAVGMRNKPARGSFRVRGLPAEATARVLGEDRAIAVRDGQFADDFPAYGVHLYRITAGGPAAGKSPGPSCQDRSRGGCDSIAVSDHRGLLLAGSLVLTFGRFRCDIRHRAARNSTATTIPSNQKIALVSGEKGWAGVSRK